MRFSSLLSGFWFVCVYAALDQEPTTWASDVGSCLRWCLFLDYIIGYVCILLSGLFDITTCCSASAHNSWSSAVSRCIWTLGALVVYVCMYVYVYTYMYTCMYRERERARYYCVYCLFMLYIGILFVCIWTLRSASQGSMHNGCHSKADMSYRKQWLYHNISV